MVPLPFRPIPLILVLAPLAAGGVACAGSDGGSGGGETVAAPDGAFPDGDLAAPTVDPDGALADRYDRADRVVEARVLAVDSGRRTYGSFGELPSTRVTFAVETAWKGAPAGEEMILRFMGGPADDGRSLGVSGIPRFEIGDHDLLFVRDGESPCPLVDWDRGRIRLGPDGPTTNAGTPLAADPRVALDRLAR